MLAVLGGVATGLSVMSKGPVPAATVMIPLGVWLMMYHRRREVWTGVGLAAGVSVLVFLPWLVVIGGIPGILAAHTPGAWEKWYAELFQFGTGNAATAHAGTKAELSDPWYYYMQMFYWVTPLVPTFVAGLLLPFLPARSEPPPSARERRGRWLMWMVLVGGLVLLSVPSEKKPRYALQLFPFAALLCGAVWQEFARLRKEQKVEPAAAAVLIAQALFFVVPAVVGIGAGVWVWVMGSFPKWPVVAEAIRAVRPGVAVGLFAVLGVMARGSGGKRRGGGLAGGRRRWRRAGACLFL